MLLKWLDNLDGRYRVWSNEMARYGQFEIIDGEDFKNLQMIATKYPGFLQMVEETE
jgi:hypothetical protein